MKQQTTTHRPLPSIGMNLRQGIRSLCGELGGIRTHDPRLKRALLYQLSYELVQGRFLQTTTARV
jgi:hypothetical protein